MNASSPDPFDAGAVLAQLTEPDLWRFLSRFSPPGARRILHSVFEELGLHALPPEARDARDRMLLANARRLGLELSATRARAFLARHQRLQSLRNAEELLCVYGDVDAQVRWAEETFAVRGLKPAARIAAAERGAVVVGAHLGPMVYYVPMLVYFLSRAGRVPEIVAVMNAPLPAQGASMREQVQRFAPHHAASFSLLAKRPGGELTLWRELDAAVRRGAWVLMQMDVVLGGRNPRPLPFAGKSLRLPGVWGAVRLARRHGVPLLPVVTWRTRREGLGLRVETPIEVRGPTSEDASPRDRAGAEDSIARDLARCLETWVFKDLADWGQLPRAHALLPEVSPPDEGE